MMMVKETCTIQVRMCGGLGNQLFQLCAGMFAARQNPPAKIWLDTRFLNAYEVSRNFEIGSIIKSLPDVRADAPPTKLLGFASRCRLGRLLNMMWHGYACVGSVDGLRKLQGRSMTHILLDGYFQHPGFVFPDFHRQALFANLKHEFGYLQGRFFSQQEKQHVAIHIRRGDYVSSKAASKVFRTIPLDYYRAAVKKFPLNAKFLIFGDDSHQNSIFAKEINGIDVTSHGMTVMEEFLLMAFCDQYIIANSTFSWWAAYLGWSEGKRIIAPLHWYKSDKLNSENQLIMLPFIETI